MTDTTSRLHRLPEAVRAEIAYQVDLALSVKEPHIEYRAHKKRRIRYRTELIEQTYVATLTQAEREQSPVLHPGDTPEICARRRADLYEATRPKRRAA